MWTAALRHPTLLVGLTVDREALAARIDSRVDAMLTAGAAAEARAADERGVSRTARAALGFEELLEGHDAPLPPSAIEAIKTAHRRYARRQLSWMRRMGGITLIDRGDRADTEIAAEIANSLEDGIAVIRRVFEWFEETPFEVVRSAVLEEETYEAVGARFAKAGHPIPFDIAPEMEIAAEGLGGMRDTPAFNGRTGWVRFWRTWYEAWEGYELRASGWLQVGDKVLVDALNIARGAGSGVVVERLVTQVWTVRDGTVFRLAGYDSREEALAAIGAD
jgi:hypothetical protein